jgi:glycolate dehydrogenase FAD-binding subunit
MSVAREGLLPRLEQVAGADRVVAQPELLARYEADGLRPFAAIQPASAEELAAIVQFAAAEQLAILPVGSATKLCQGMPPKRYDLAVDLGHLKRVLAYDPGDLTLSVEAGARLSEVARMLDQERQFLPFAVPFAAHATLGGILATNCSSPLRQFYGTARDFVIGMEFVTGDGRRAKSGGRVVKNVAGYDLHKLMIGALGTLGIITAANFKTFPLPQATGAWTANFRDSGGALRFRAAVAHSQLAPRTFDLACPEAGRILQRGAGTTRAQLAAGWTALVAAGGSDRAVKRHGRELERLASEGNATAFVELAPEECAPLWERLREFSQVIGEASAAATLVKFSVLPGQFPALLDRAAAIAARHELRSARIVRAAGLIYWAVLPEAGRPIEQLAGAAAELFDAAREVGGHAVIERCPTELKRHVNVWGPAGEELKLMQKLKAVFDPQGILAPGRYLGGI